MPTTELQKLADAGNLDAFESRCLELLGSGAVRLGELTTPFQRLQKAGKTERVAALAQMALDAAGDQDDPRAALKVARVALDADPNSAELRKRVLELYKRGFGSHAGFAALLDASGLESGRPLRNAMRLLDVCLSLKPGDTLLSRTDGHAVEVVEVDPLSAMFTLRRAGGRPTTLGALELVREYDTVDAGDFRVLRQLWPDRLPQLVKDDPVKLVIGMIHAHGDAVDSDSLKAELVPRYLAAKDWTSWWSNARALMKRSPHIIMEGRSPVLLKFSAEGQTLEKETWELYESKREPVEWYGVIDAYLREKGKWKEPADKELLARFHDHLVAHAEQVRGRRPGAALACALIIERLGEAGLEIPASSKGMAAAMLRAAENPTQLIMSLEEDLFWEYALATLEQARPDDAAGRMVELWPRASAGLLDRIASAALAAGMTEQVQAFINAALENPASNPETLYWLWKGGAREAKVNVPSPKDLFVKILDTLSALGRTLNAPADVVKQFRNRMKTALGLRDYAMVKACLEQIGAEQAVTIRGQLERLDGIGENARGAMIELLRKVHPLLWVKPVKRLEAWEDEGVVWTTAEGLRRKTDERDHLLNVTMRENAKRIGEAAALGDLSENSEYKFALEERDLLRARLAQMNNELSLARVIEPSTVDTESVGVGTRATLRDVSSGAERTLTFLGPFDGDVEKGIFNYRAPVSQKLMGLRVGERVNLTLDGREAEYEIAAIANALRG